MARYRQTADSATRRRWADGLRRGASLLAGASLLLLVAFGAIPAIQRLPPVREVRAAIERRNIDATALFYSECTLSAESEAAVRAALQYPPNRLVE